MQNNRLRRKLKDADQRQTAREPAPIPDVHFTNVADYRPRTIGQAIQVQPKSVVPTSTRSDREVRAGPLESRSPCTQDNAARLVGLHCTSNRNAMTDLHYQQLGRLPGKLRACIRITSARQRSATHCKSDSPEAFLSRVGSASSPTVCRT